MNATCRTWMSEVLNTGGFLRVGEWLGGPRVAIFALHRVLPKEELANSYNPYIVIESRCFEQFIMWLLKDWDVVPLIDLIQRSTGSATRNSCALTFDDAWEDNYRIAFPILQKKRLPATIFLPTRYLGGTESIPEERLGLLIRRCVEQNRERELVRKFRGLAPGAMRLDGASDISREMKRLPLTNKLSALEALESCFGREPDMHHHLDWPQIFEMEKTGITFGSHTVNHCLLAREADEVIREELYASKQILRDKLQSPLNVLAYPNGDFDARVVKIATEVGYEAAVTTEIGTLTKSTDRYRLPRIPIDTLVLGDQRGQFSTARARLHALRAPAIRHEC